MRRLFRKYDAENWSGKAVSAHDAVRIEIAVQAAIAGSRFEIFQRDLIAGCAEIDWQHDHPMTLWTVALYASVFPVCEMPREIRRTDGLIHFAEPSVALEHSKLDLFWSDRDLVCLALNRLKNLLFTYRPPRATLRLMALSRLVSSASQTLKTR